RGFDHGEAVGADRGRAGERRVLAHPRVEDAHVALAAWGVELDRLAARQLIALLLLGHALVREVDAGDEAVAQAAGVGVDPRRHPVVLRVRLLLRAAGRLLLRGADRAAEQVID